MENRAGRRMGECVYCGKYRPLSRDHIPPANLFSAPRPGDLITVPSCDACNNAASKDDEYFRLAVTAGINPTEFPNEFALSIKAIRKLGMPQKRGLAKMMLTSFTKVPVYSRGGLYLGNAGSLSLDIARIQRAVDRIIRGLFYHHMNKRLPTTGSVSIFSDWFDPILPEELRDRVETASEFLRSVEPIVVGSGVFCYRYRIIEDEAYGSIWWLSFYDHRRFLCSTKCDVEPAKTLVNTQR